MDALKDECWYCSELADPVSHQVNREALDAYVARGRASTSTVTLSDARAVTSVSVKDASQGDVRGLPCGARSLLLDPRTGAIVCRGINKFFDLGEVSDAWMTDARLWCHVGYRVWAVRKLAGFVVTVFSLDGRRLELMSKHVLAGPHVDAARQLLDQLSETQQARLAEDLFAWDACASFECIRRAEDFQHPVLEEELFDQQLVLIAVQKRSQLREESVAFACMTAIAISWGVSCAPAVMVQDQPALQDVLRAVETWHSVYPPFAACPVLAEGFVLLIEVGAPSASTERGKAADAALAWCNPIRLKLKTPRYVVLRAFRSLVLRDSRPPVFLYHHGLLGWLRAFAKDSAEYVRNKVAEGGVSGLSAAFEAAMQSTGRVRYRDASSTVGQALTHLQSVSARCANPRCPCPLTVLVLCGLPGAGKTTVSKRLVELMTADSAEKSHFHVVVHVSRDVVTRDVALQHGIDDTSSKHKQRRLRALVHDAVCDQMREVARWCQETQERGLLIFDACNATPASRQVWRRSFPRVLDAYLILHVDCADAAVSAQRAGHRDGHELLRSAAEAQHALYTVRRKFVPPTKAEGEDGCWYVDTTRQTVEEAAGAVHAQLRHLWVRVAAQKTGEAPGDNTRVNGTVVCRSLSVAELRAEVLQRHAAVLHSLLDLSDSAAAELENIPALLSADNSRPAKATSLQVRLSACSGALLWRVVASVLGPSLSPALAQTLSPPSAVSSLSAVGRRLLSKVTHALWGDPAASEISLPSDPNSANRSFSEASGKVTKGHLKWLRGWLLRGKEPGSLTEVAAALQGRFDKLTPSPHVTLLHGGSAVPHVKDTDVQRFLAAAKLQLGDEVTVHLKTLLMDRHAVCFGVVLGGGLAVQGNTNLEEEGEEEEGHDGKGVPLHLTVATADGTAAAYAGGMFASFAAWQRENEALLMRQSAPQGAVVRSQRKFHNFVEYQLDSEVVLRGVVELSSQ